MIHKVTHAGEHVISIYKDPCARIILLALGRKIRPGHPAQRERKIIWDGKRKANLFYIGHFTVLHLRVYYRVWGGDNENLGKVTSDKPIGIDSDFSVL